MGQRRTTQKTAKLSIKKETLRKLQLQTLSDADLRAVAGARSGCCSQDLCAPSTAGAGC